MALKGADPIASHTITEHGELVVARRDEEDALCGGKEEKGWGGGKRAGKFKSGCPGGVAKKKKRKKKKRVNSKNNPPKYKSERCEWLQNRHAAVKRGCSATLLTVEGALGQDGKAGKTWYYCGRV